MMVTFLNCDICGCLLGFQMDSKQHVTTQEAIKLHVAWHKTLAVQP